MISCTWSPVRVLGKTFRLVGAGAGWCGWPPGGGGCGGACATVVTANKATPSKAAADAGTAFSLKMDRSSRRESLFLSDGTLRHKDAGPGQRFRSRDAGIVGDGIPQRPVE